MPELPIGPGREGRAAAIHRRDVLRAGSLGLFGLGLPGWRRATAAAGTVASPRAEACIVVWLQGGLSHLDSFDPKPDAPSAIRGAFGTIATRVPGIRLADPLPLLAQGLDTFAILRGLDPGTGTHGVADAQALSGRPFRPDRMAPALGALVARELGPRGAVPPYVQIGTALTTAFGGGRAGILGDQYNPLVLPGDPAPAADGDPFPTAPPEFRRALDLAREPVRLRERYGDHDLGRGCLLARRLVEAGVRFVTVTDAGWDTHHDGFRALGRSLLPRLDSALASLLRDLADRGRLESTLVVVLTDFGRTPVVNGSDGRDHWSRASVALVAGGGIAGGRVVGGTDAHGAEALGTPHGTGDVAATIAERLGLPLDIRHQGPDGVPVRLTLPGRPIPELVGVRLDRIGEFG